MIWLTRNNYRTWQTITVVFEETSTICTQCVYVHMHSFIQEYISSKSVQLLQTAFLHIDVTSASVNPISGGTSCTYVNHSLLSSSRQTNHIQPVPFKGPDSVVDS